MERPEALQEHRWLQRLVGDWKWEMSGADGQTYTGTSRVRPLGELWIQEEMEMGDDQSVLTLGYDRKKRRFVGTFLNTLGEHLWIYDGVLDEKGSRLLLESEGPDMQDPDKRGRYRDVVEIVGDDEHLLRSELWKNGEWVEHMRMRFRRAR